MDVVIGLGSNLGDRLVMLRRAADRLIERLFGEDATGPAGGRSSTLARRSAVVESAPAGGPPQGPYLNAALWLSIECVPRDLLRIALEVERELGRVRPEPVRWGPRVIDIDLLWIADQIIDEPDLQLPHPRLRERPFALQPLAQVAPDAADPIDGIRYAELAATGPRLSVVAML
jgi:2-amino-4-hydroxy-6-hydroxymethyldihydropteridine diphosphokinase